MSLLGDVLHARGLVSLGHPSQWSERWARHGGRESQAGIVVSDESALGLTAVSRAVRLHATIPAALPWHLIETDTAGATRGVSRGPGRVAPRHPAHRLLHDAWNGEQVLALSWAQVLWDRMARGNGIAEIERDGAGRPVALWPIPERFVRLERWYPRDAGGYTTSVEDASIEARRAGGRLLYRVDGTTGGPVYLRPDEVIHLADWRVDRGQGLWARARIVDHLDAIGLALARQTHAGSLFGQGSVPPIAIRRPLEAPFLSESEEATRLLAWESSHRGSHRAGRVAILQEGEEVTQLAWSPRESELIQGQQFGVLDAARIYDLPPHMLYWLERATFSNIEHQGIETMMLTWVPTIRSFEQEMTRKLLTPEERRRLAAVSTLEGLARGDMRARAEFYSRLIGVGVMTPAEARDLEDLPQRPEADRLFRPVNWAPIDAPAPGPKAPPPPAAEPDDTAARLRVAHRPLLVDAADRVLRRAEGELHRRAGDAERWWPTWARETLVPWAEGIVAPIVDAHLRAGGVLARADWRDAIAAILDDPTSATADTIAAAILGGE